MLPNKMIIGITGNIGSGKSTVSSFIQPSYTVHSADILARAALEENDVRQILTNAWGKEYFQDGSPDRARIAEKVFQDKEALHFLNSVMHPVILLMMQRIVEQHEERYVFFEVPLLFEAHLQQCFDHIILVTAPLPLRIQRLMARDNDEKDNIMLRIASQMPDEEKLKDADTVFANSYATPTQLSIDVQSWLEILPYLRSKPHRIPFDQCTKKAVD